MKQGDGYDGVSWCCKSSHIIIKLSKVNVTNDICFKCLHNEPNSVRNDPYCSLEEIGHTFMIGYKTNYAKPCHTFQQ